MRAWWLLATTLPIVVIAQPAAEAQAPYQLIGEGLASCPEGYVCGWEERGYQGRGVAIFGDEANWGALPPEYAIINDSAESFYNNGYGAGEDENPDVLLYRGTGYAGEPVTLCNGEALADVAWWADRVSSNDWRYLGYCNGTPSPGPMGEYRVITWNIASSARHQDDPAQLAQEVARVAEAGQGADLLLLQETCLADFYRLAELLPSWVLKHAAYAESSGAVKTCTGARQGESFGLIIGSRRRVDGFSAVPQTSPGGATQKVALCVRQSATGVQACTAHFTNKIDDPDGSYRLPQAQSMADLVREGRSVGFHTLTGGDFNANPPPADNSSLAPLYDEAAGLSECDGPNPEETHGEGKLDYLFYDTGSADVRYCNAVADQAWSDHARLIGDFVFF